MTSTVFVFLLAVSCVHAVQYVVNPDKDDFDGVGVGLVSRPTYCDKTTKKGDLLRVYFNGTLADGTVIDKRHNTRLLEFILGDGQMINGFEAGLYDMCAGEVRHLSVPPQFGYGGHGLGNMPSRVTMYFYVKLQSFENIPNSPQIENTFFVIDSNHDGLLSKDEVKAYLKNKGTRDIAGEAGLTQMLRDIFKEEDRDMNGIISLREFSGTKHQEL